MEAVDLMGTVIGDGYLSAVVVACEDAWLRKYWRCYYDGDQDQDDWDIVEFKGVPTAVAERLLAQGTQEQWYDDGYSAMQVASAFSGRD